MQNASITLHPSKQRMQVQVDGILMADSTSTFELRKDGYRLSTGVSAQGLFNDEDMFYLSLGET